MLIIISYYLLPTTNLKPRIPMRNFRLWWNILVLSSQYNPPQFVELVMVLLFLTFWVIWKATDSWPFLALGLSYVMGFATSILVRETLTPSPYRYFIQILAIMLLMFSIYGFVWLIP